MNESRVKTQNRLVMKHLLHSNGMTQRDADYLGVKRLASRICDLRKAGMKIDRKMIAVKNKDGSISHVAFYSSNDIAFAYKYGRICILDNQVCHRQIACRGCQAWRNEFIRSEEDE